MKVDPLVDKIADIARIAIGDPTMSKEDINRVGLAFLIVARACFVATGSTKAAAEQFYRAADQMATHKDDK